MIKYYPIPEETRAQIFFKDEGFTGEEWRAEIEINGEIKALIDKDGNRYTTLEELQNIRVERLTLINHHIIHANTNEDL